jgi:hypothetical protein
MVGVRGELKNFACRSRNMSRSTEAVLTISVLLVGGGISAGETGLLFIPSSDHCHWLVDNAANMA